MKNNLSSLWPPRISNATRRDWNNVKLAAREFWKEMRDPFTAAVLLWSVTVLVGLWIAAWLGV
jgi:hypothetical protein